MFCVVCNLLLYVAVIVAMKFCLLEYYFTVCTYYLKCGSRYRCIKTIYGSFCIRLSLLLL